MTGHLNSHRELLQRDRLLPGLPLLFDPARLARSLEACSGAHVTALRPVYVRYKRGTSCLVGYLVNGSMGRSFVYAKAYRHPFDDKFRNESWRWRDCAATWLGPRPAVMREEAVIAWAFPNDSRLRMLFRTADPDGRDLLLRRAVRTGPLSSGEIRPLAYRPERRFVAEVYPSYAATPAAVMKMYTRGGYDHAVHRANAAAPRGVLRVPRRLARDSRRHLLFQEWLPGRLAADIARSDGESNGQAGLIGGALAELHGQPLPPALLHSSRPYDAAGITRALDDVEFLFPHLAAPLARLRARLAGALDPRQPDTLVHGDFHLRQVLVDASRVGIVDFDRAGGGPAAGDIGCCFAHLERDVLGGDLDEVRAGDAAAALLAGYERLRPLPAPRALDACTAAALARLLPEPFRRCRPDASDLTARMLDRALAFVTRAESAMVAL